MPPMPMPMSMMMIEITQKMGADPPPAIHDRFHDQGSAHRIPPHPSSLALASPSRFSSRFSTLDFSVSIPYPVPLCSVLTLLHGTATSFGACPYVVHSHISFNSAVLLHIFSSLLLGASGTRPLRP